MKTFTIFLLICFLVNFAYQNVAQNLSTTNIRYCGRRLTIKINEIQLKCKWPKQTKSTHGIAYNCCKLGCNEKYIFDWVCYGKLDECPVATTCKP